MDKCYTSLLLVGVHCVCVFVIQVYHQGSGSSYMIQKLATFKHGADQSTSAAQLFPAGDTMAISVEHLSPWGVGQCSWWCIALAFTCLCKN